MSKTIKEIKADMRKVFVNKLLEIDELTKESITGRRKLTDEEKQRKVDEYCRDTLLKFLYEKDGDTKYLS